MEATLEKTTSTRSLRYLVIGTTGFSGIQSISWQDVAQVNIVDYDIVIVDIVSLAPLIKEAAINWDILLRVRLGLVRLLGSSGEIIVLADRAEKNTLRWAAHFKNVSASNYSPLPIQIACYNEEGITIDLASECKFHTYLTKLKKWNFHIELYKDWRTQELIPFFGETAPSMSVLMKNREGRNLATEYRINTPIAVASKFLSSLGKKTEEVVQPKITILPAIASMTTHEMISEILIALGLSHVEEKMPEWVESVEIPGVSEIQKKLAKIKDEVRALHEQEVGLEKEIKSAQNYRKLLYTQGAELEDVVKTSLELLGGTIIPRKYDQEEYILSYKGSEYLIEVKGISKGTAIHHVRQLIVYNLTAMQIVGHELSGILITNSWREHPVEERNKANTLEFPTNVVEVAKNNNVVLLSTRVLFEMVAKVLSNEVDGIEVIEKLTKGSGVVKLD